MRQFSSTRIAVVALALGLLAARATVSFADTALSVQQQALQPSQTQANSYDPSQIGGHNFGPYDSPDFVVRPSDIHN